MPSLLITVFTLQLVIHLVNTIGAPAISDLLWVLWNKLPTPTSKSVEDQTRLRRDVVRLKREMNSTSSQDEFAKWAKLRRQHDKALAEYDEKTSSLQAFKTSFERYVSVARWLSTNGLRFFLQFWYSRRPLFWIPQGWLPGYVEWLLSFPRAPRGSISIQVWGAACACAIHLVGAAVTAIVVLVIEQKQKLAPGKGTPMKMGARSGGGEKAKKEL
ncbi:chd5 domain-containing protein [Lasallia pustulata]|uniref:Chd5 domain-containing protein n=1 Tax=Lasallia pustulata TaxID=136370 RepID=A0A1W5DCH9_9LECA|nr:chd5 domain-containing protein [Lasallia pustulata]